MRSQNHWQEAAPAQDKLSSSQPFAVDCLSPSEWLQWICLPKMAELIESQQALPSGFAITPYFEEAWKNQYQYQDILVVLKLIDEVCA